jgi:hypothetical protein
VIPEVTVNGRIVDSPLVRAGVSQHFTTRFGIVSHSANQTDWTLTVLRRQVRNIENLTDDDLVWLLARGWEP